MKTTSDKSATFYGKATRVFVDYEDYTREECIFYYLVLEKVIGIAGLKPSNYFISGLAAVIESSDFIKTLFAERFSAQNELSVDEMAKELKLTKQGLLLRFEEGYNFIRSRDSQYDISKRIALLNHSIRYLENKSQTHAHQYKRKKLPLETLPLRTHAYNCLKEYGIHTVAAFMALKEDEIKTMPGVGEKTFYSIVAVQRKLLDEFNSVGCKEYELSLDELGLGVRAINCVRRIGVKTVEEFINLTKADVLKVWHTGEKTWLEIYEKQQSLKFGEI